MGITKQPQDDLYARIVVMEDQPDMQVQIAHALREMGFEVFEVENSDELVMEVEEHNIRIAILDHDIHGKPEGMDGLERLKNRYGEDVLVCLYSGVATDRDKKRAHSLKVDVFYRKSSSVNQDIYNIFERFFLHNRSANPVARMIIEENLQDQNFQRWLSDIYQQKRTGRVFLASERNCITFEKKMLNSSWLKKNRGKYIAIVKGEVVGIEEDRKKLLAQIRKDYPKTRRFFCKIEDRIVKLPSILYFENLDDV